MERKFVKNKKAITELILSILFPRHCPICDELVPMGAYICKKCEMALPFIVEPACKKCGKQLEEEEREYCTDCMKKQHAFKQGKALFSYEKELKRSMYRFKYAKRREYADYFAKEAAIRYGAWIKRRGIEVIIPIPMYGPKKKRRGYNQAETFAKSLAKETKLPMKANLMKRVKNTVPQKELDDKGRKDNLKGAFKLKTNIVEYRKILLVDDIYTTGSTMDAAASCLIDAGAGEIYLLSICIGEGY